MNSEVHVPSELLQTDNTKAIPIGERVTFTPKRVTLGTNLIKAWMHRASPAAAACTSAVPPF